MERFCVFDIETVALADAAAYIPPPKPRANLKDPAKIEADIAEKRAAVLEKAALDPDLCRVVAAAWDCYGQAESAVCEDAAQEAGSSGAVLAAESGRDVGGVQLFEL